MKKEYDFSRGRRGPVLGAPSGKTRITIRIDDDILRWFKTQVHKADGGSYQTGMNEALRRAMDATEGHVEGSLRRVLREELRAYRVRPKSARARR
jgi:BrnA antitoxin of type II toxin-antitoxin system